MPKFTYSAKKGPQEKVCGVIEAKGRFQAIAIIEEKGLFPISVEENSEGSLSGGRAFSLKRIRLRELTVFTRQLSNLIESGLTIAHALNVIITQTTNPALRNILSDIGERIKDGATFSEALSSHPGQFSQYYCAVIKAGEISGSLETVLVSLADFSEQEERSRSDILSALTYPALIINVGFITIYALLVYAVPQLTSMFEEAGEALPFPTQLLISLSNALRRYWWLLLLTAFAIFFAIKRPKSQNEKLFWAKLLLSIPIAGKIILKSEMAHFARMLSLLIESGVSIVVALDAVNNTVVNSVIKLEIKNIAADIRDGASLSQAAKKSVYFPDYAVSIMHVGEEAGTLEKSLKRIAVSYEEELTRLRRALTSLLEPAMMLLMGLVVGFIVIAMLLPIFQINLITR